MPQIVTMNEELHEKMRGDGYVPDITWASRGTGIAEHTKEQLLCEHSERLALVYGVTHPRCWVASWWSRMRTGGMCLSKASVRVGTVGDSSQFIVCL
jgi:hypothetical protein